MLIGQIIQKESYVMKKIVMVLAIIFTILNISYADEVSLKEMKNFLSIED